MDHLVLTVIAEDQPGLVERLADCIARHGGNWLDSRMSRMAGQFAGILQVAVPTSAQAELFDALRELESQGIRVLLAPSGSAPGRSWRMVRLQLVGNDRPGIVRDITRLLASHGVNLENRGNGNRARADDQRIAVPRRRPPGGADRVAARAIAAAPGNPGGRPDGGAQAASGRVSALRAAIAPPLQATALLPTTRQAS